MEHIESIRSLESRLTFTSIRSIRIRFGKRDILKKLNPHWKDCRDKIRDIYNARLKVERIATEIDQLAQYGTILPDNMQGLNDDQIAELKESV